MHGARGRAAALVVNAGALTHTSWSLHDALAAFDGVVVELHLSNPAAREPFRHTSVVAPVADGCIAGFGGLGYRAGGGGRGHRLLAERSGAGRRVIPVELTPLDLAPLAAAGRLDRLRAGLRRAPGSTAAAVDALLVTTPANVR